MDVTFVTTYIHTHGQNSQIKLSKNAHSMFEMECHNSAAGQNPIDLEQLLLLWLLTSWIFYILYISAWHRLEASIVKRATQGSLTMTTPFTALSQSPTMPCTLNHNISVQLYPGSVEPKSEGGFSAQCNN